MKSRRSNTLKRAGNTGMMIVILVCIVASLSLLFVKKFNESNPMRLQEQRFVLADIADMERFKQICSGENASTDAMVALRDDDDPNYLFLKVLLLQSYMYEMGREQTVWNSVQSSDFKLVSDTGDIWAPLLLVDGYSDQKDGVERVVIGPNKVFREGTKYTFEDHPAFAHEKDIDDGGHSELLQTMRMAKSLTTIGGGTTTRMMDWVRAPFEERMSIIQPPQLNGNVWLATKQYQEEDAWVGIEANLIFPLPPPGTKVKLVFGGDEKNAVPVDVR